MEKTVKLTTSEATGHNRSPETVHQLALKVNQ